MPEVEERFTVILPGLVTINGKGVPSIVAMPTILCDMSKRDTARIELGLLNLLGEQAKEQVK